MRTWDKSQVKHWLQSMRYLKTAASLANIRRSNKSSASKKKNKPKKKWFDKECYTIRSDLKRLGRQIRNNPYNLGIQHQYMSVRKGYKKLVKKKKAMYRDNILGQMDKLHENNPAAFWKLYDQLKDLDRSQAANPIPAEEWVEHFTNLMKESQCDQAAEDDRQMDEYIKSNADQIFNELNF